MKKSISVSIALQQSRVYSLKETPLNKSSRFIRIRPELFDIGLSDTELVVLEFLQDYEYRDSTKCPSLSYLSKRLRHSRNSIQLAIKHLELVGLIMKIRLPAVIGGNGVPYRSQRYKILYAYDPRKKKQATESNVIQLVRGASL